MRLSTISIICAFLASALAMPTQDSALSTPDVNPQSKPTLPETDLDVQNIAKRDIFAKRCCILCDNNRCGSRNEKREPFYTEEEAMTAPERSEVAKRDIFAKRCCILCDNSNRCGASGVETREVFHTEEEALATPF